MKPPLNLRNLTFAVALLLSGGMSVPASACSIDYPPGYDREKALISAVTRAEHIIEIRVLRSSAFLRRPAIVRVTQVLRGDVAEGAVLRLTTAPGSACGAGELLKGQRGFTILRSLDPDQLYFSGFLTPEQIAAAKEECPRS